MMSDPASIFSSLRPRQWLKNLVVFAAILFSGELFIPEKFMPVFYTFLIFSIASSAMYLVNDVVDRPRDKVHFSKKNRPIASGKVDERTAIILAILLGIVALTTSYFLQTYLFFIILAYLTIQLSYTFFLKEIIIIDILVIAFTFMLRIFGGSIVAAAPLSSWLILTTMMLALFLGIGKRKSELTLLSGVKVGEHRKTLLSYPEKLLDGLAFTMATATLITYSLFTFNSPEAQGGGFFGTFLPTTLASPKLLMLTIPIVVYGIFRYLYLVFERREGESPEKVLLSDRPLFLSVSLWAIVAIFLLYAVSF